MLAQAVGPVLLASHTPPSGIPFLSYSPTEKLELTDAAVSGETHSQNCMPPYPLASINAGAFVSPLAKNKSAAAYACYRAPVCPAVHIARKPDDPPSTVLPSSPGKAAGRGL